MFKLNRLFIIATLFTSFAAQAGLVEDVLLPLIGKEAVEKIVTKVGQDGAENIARAAQESIAQVGRLTTIQNLKLAVSHGGNILLNVKNMASGAWSYVPGACRVTSEAVVGSARVVNNSTAWLAGHPRVCFVLGAAAAASTIYYGVPWLYRRLRLQNRGRRVAGNIQGNFFARFWS